MTQRKLNHSPWRSLGLAVLLIMGCLVAATGATLARYRVDNKANISFTARAPEQIYLGQMIRAEADGTSIFDSAAVGSWETVDGQTQLEFAVANGTSEDEYSAVDQQIRVQLIGSLGIWDGTQTIDVKLLIPREADPGDDVAEPAEGENAVVVYDEIKATATRIQSESPMNTTFGDGWVFSFLDDEGEEMAWLLEGGEFSVISMTLVIDGVELTDPSLLQLQITGEFAQ